MDEESSSPVVPPDDVSTDVTGAVPEAPDRSVIRLLGEAVIAVAKRPSRATYATWMRVIKPAWILPLLAVLVLLDIFNTAIATAIEIETMAPGASAIHYRFGAPSPFDWVIYILVISPLVGLLSFALPVFLIAALIPAEQGSLKERAIQVARPYLLTQFVVTCISLFMSQPEFALRRTAFGQSALVNFVLTVVLDLAIAIYVLVATVNALAAGSNKNRLLIFGIATLTSSISLLIGLYGVGVLLFRFGIHLPVGI